MHWPAAIRCSSARPPLSCRASSWRTRWPFALALADAEDDAYGRAAARFAARWSLELPAVSLEEAQAVGVALQALRAPETAPMGHQLLATLVRARGLERMERALAGHPAATR